MTWEEILSLTLEEHYNMIDIDKKIKMDIIQFIRSKGA